MKHNALVIAPNRVQLSLLLLENWEYFCEIFEVSFVGVEQAIDVLFKTVLVIKYTGHCLGSISHVLLYKLVYPYWARTKLPRNDKSLSLRPSFALKGFYLPAPKYEQIL